MASKQASAPTRFAEYQEAGGATVPLRLTILPLPTLPPSCRREPGSDVVRATGGKYYRTVERSLPDGSAVAFSLVPQRRPDDPPTFYMMRDKVSNGLFRKFVRAERRPWLTTHAALALANLGSTGAAPWLPAASTWATVPEWERGGEREFARDRFEDLGARDDNLPVLRVTAVEAYEFARWMGAALPDLREWDRAAGFDEEPRRQGPFAAKAGDWEKLTPGEKATFGVKLGELCRGPLPLDAPTVDVSPFGCKHMSGNGREWTNRVLVLDLNRPDRTLPQRLAEGFQDTDAVQLRGRSYRFDHPRLFYEQNDESQPPLQPEPDIGFRVILRP